MISFQFKWAKQATLLLEYISRPFFFLVLLTFPIISVWNFSYFFYLCSWQHFLAGTALGAGGYICGALLAALVKQGRAQIVAISLETAIQNGGIAFVVVNLTFDSPYSDMATIPILSMFFFATGPVMFLVYGGYLVIRFDNSHLQSIDQYCFHSRRILERCGYKVVAKEQPLAEPVEKGILKDGKSHPLILKV